MPDWTPFLTGGAAGSVLGVVVGGLTSNLSHELLEEWRERQAEQRERARERRAELRALREAKRTRLFPILDEMFDAATTMMEEARELLAERQRVQGTREHFWEAGDELYSPEMTKAIEQFGHLVMALRREMEAPEIVMAVTNVKDSYDELDADLTAAYWDAGEWRCRDTWLRTLLQEIAEQAKNLQQAVLSVKAELEDPV